MAYTNEWIDPFWNSDPEMGRHQFIKLNYVPDGYIPEHYPGDQWTFYQCSMCGYVIKFNYNISKTYGYEKMIPLPVWGPHCIARQIRFVMDR